MPEFKAAVAHWPLDRLIPHARNARTHSEAQIAQIAGSVVEFGFVNPVLVGDDGVMVAGHGRVLAARKLGLATVPVIVLKHLTATQRRALMIADNKLALNAGWDDETLAAEIAGLKSEDFDIDLLGFGENELAELLADKTDGLTDPDDVPPPPIDPISRLGDVWLLGRHRIICGDCTDKEVVERVLLGGLADMVFTDPPYGLSFQSGMSKGGTATRFDKLQNDDRMLNIASIVDGALRNDAAMFIWTSHQVYPQWRNQFAEFYKHTIIWHKPGGGIGDLKGNYATDYELCLFGVKGAVRFRNKRGMAVWTVSKDPVMEYKHPTQKPVALPLRAISDFTDANNTVLDCFGGSGSTMIACEQLGRMARTIELSPAYVDVAVIRWQDFTGETAVLEGDGRTYSEIAASKKAA